MTGTGFIGGTGFGVRRATRADLPAIGQVLGRAFDDDPVMNFVIRSRPVAPRVGLLLGLVAEVHLPDESVLVAEDSKSGEILGAAVWAPPNRWRVPLTAYLRHLPTLIHIVGLRGVTKVKVLSDIERHHPPEPHHYLAVLGTDPAHRGRGIGGALMAPVLERCDVEGLPAYLESSKESNVPYYARVGFHVTAPHTIRNGPIMQFMWRDAPS